MISSSPREHSNSADIPTSILEGAVRLERASPKHLAGLDALLNDAVTAEWLGGKRTPEAISRTIADEQRHWKEHSFGPWVLRDHVSDAIIGRGGLRYASVLSHTEVELFYAVAPSRWNQGIATALAEAALLVGLECIGLESIVGFTLQSNVASRRVMEKVGLTYQQVIEHAGLPHVLYRVTRDTFSVRQKASPGLD